MSLELLGTYQLHKESHKIMCAFQSDIHLTVITKICPCNTQRTFTGKKMKISLEKSIFLIFLLKPLIVGTHNL